MTGKRDEKITIKVMSFNVKRNLFSFGRHAWDKRAALVAEVIRRNGPDILGTQELTEVTLGDLQRLLPEYAFVGQGRGGGSRGEYSAVFYRKDRFTLLSQDTFWLSKTPRIPSRSWLAFFPRICTWCELCPNDAPEKTIRVYNTHLDHVSYFARVNGLRLICRQILERYHQAPGPVVFMGDFNATPNSRTLRKWQVEELQKEGGVVLKDSYHMLLKSPAQQLPGCSYHGFRGRVPGNPIDYIFTSGDVTLRGVTLERARGQDTYPSDHYPVVAEMEL